MECRQGKAIVQFSSVEAASSFVAACEKDPVKINNVLPVHPSYCSISKPNEAKVAPVTNITDSMDGSTTVCVLC